MEERIDELKGNVKAAIGKVTDNDRMEAEGKAEAAGAKAERHVKGGAKEVGGKLKEGLGALTGDEATRAAGKADQLRGKADRTD